MKPVFLSLLLSQMASILAGLIIVFVFMFDPFVVIYIKGLFFSSVMLAILLSIVVNGCFFLVRRWDGRIEKLGGFTVTTCLWACGFLPLFILRFAFSWSVPQVIAILMLIITAEMAVIGVISTYFLRSNYFIPPKPHEPWRW